MLPAYSPEAFVILEKKKNRILLKSKAPGLHGNTVLFLMVYCGRTDQRQDTAEGFKVVSRTP